MFTSATCRADHPVFLYSAKLPQETETETETETEAETQPDYTPAAGHRETERAEESHAEVEPELKHEGIEVESGTEAEADMDLRRAETRTKTHPEPEAEPDPESEAEAEAEAEAEPEPEPEVGPRAEHDRAPQTKKSWAERQAEAKLLREKHSAAAEQKQSRHTEPPRMQLATVKQTTRAQQDPDADTAVADTAVAAVAAQWEAKSQATAQRELEAALEQAAREKTAAVAAAVAEANAQTQASFQRQLAAHEIAAVAQIEAMKAEAAAAREQEALKIADAVHKAVNAAAAREVELLRWIEEEKEMRAEAEEQLDSGSGAWMREQLQQLQSAHAAELRELREHAATEKAEAVSDLTVALAAEREKSSALQKSLESLQSRRFAQTVVLKKTQAMLGSMRAELQWLAAEKKTLTQRHEQQIHQLQMRMLDAGLDASLPATALGGDFSPISNWSPSSAGSASSLSVASSAAGNTALRSALPAAEKRPKPSGTFPLPATPTRRAQTEVQRQGRAQRHGGPSVPTARTPNTHSRQQPQHQPAASKKQTATLESLEANPQLSQAKRKLQSLSYGVKGQDPAKLFARYDRDNNGILDYDEFVAAVRKGGKLTATALSDTALRMIFDAVDADRNGELSIAELTSWVWAGRTDTAVITTADTDSRGTQPSAASEARASDAMRQAYPSLTMPDRAEREALFAAIDVNGNGVLSLAEIDKAVVSGVVGAALRCPDFNHKPALMRAYKAADVRGVEGSESAPDGLIERHEFFVLLRYLVYFNNLWHKFEEVDLDHDRRTDSTRYALFSCHSWPL